MWIKVEITEVSKTVLYKVEELGLSMSWNILSLLNRCNGNESLCPAFSSWKVLSVCVRDKLKVLQFWELRYIYLERLLNPAYDVALCSYFSYKVICLCSFGLFWVGFFVVFLVFFFNNLLTSSWYCAGSGHSKLIWCLWGPSVHHK